jgi:small subunit ribosomal protein S2
MMVAQEISAMGGTILFVGTKDWIADSVYQAAKVTRQFFVQRDQPWKRGTLTNREEVLRKSAATDGTIFHYGAYQSWGRKTHPPIGVMELYRREKSGKLSTLPPSQGTNALPSQPQILLPDLLIVLDGPQGETPLREAMHALVPTIAIIDTNMDPNLATYPIPGNDDALSSVSYILDSLVSAILRGQERIAQSQPAMPVDHDKDLSLDLSPKVSKYAKIERQEE